MHRTLLTIAAAASMGLACSSTKMLSTWKADDFKRGSIQKVLVIGTFKTPGVGETVEGTYVEFLASERVEAAAGHALLTADEMRRDAVVKKVEELQYDGVLLTRLLDKETEVKHYPPSQAKTPVQVGYQDDWYQDFVMSAAEVEAIGHSVEGPTVARIETRLYDARTRKLVYYAVSQTTVEAGNIAQIRAGVGKNVDQMVVSGMF